MTADSGDRGSQLRHELAACHRAAFLWARNCCRHDRFEAQDVLQASYLKVLDGQARFDGRSSFKTWLFGVIHRTAAEHRRRHALRELFSLRWGVEASMRDPAPAADAGLENTQRIEQLRQALAALPRRQREVLLLVFYHELSVDDAARVLDIGAGSARQHYARGKQRLQQRLPPVDGGRQ